MYSLIPDAVLSGVVSRGLGELARATWYHNIFLSWVLGRCVVRKGIERLRVHVSLNDAMQEMHYRVVVHFDEVLLRYLLLIRVDRLFFFFLIS